MYRNINDCDQIKKSMYSLGKAPEHLTLNQAVRLEMIAKSDNQLYREKSVFSENRQKSEHFVPCALDVHHTFIRKEACII